MVCAAIPAHDEKRGSSRHEAREGISRIVRQSADGRKGVNMTSEFLEKYEANLFVQTDPAAVFEFLTCTGIGDITKPRGPRTIKYKQDLRRSGKLVPAGAIQGVADFTTFSLTRPLETVNNFLIEQECPFNARINWACRGTRVVLSNYELGAFFLDSAFTTGAIPAPGSGGETDNDRVNTTGDIASTQFTFVYPLAGAKVTLTSTTDVYAIAVVPSECASKCGDKVGVGPGCMAGPGIHGLHHRLPVAQHGLRRDLGSPGMASLLSRRRHFEHRHRGRSEWLSRYRLGRHCPGWPRRNQLQR